MVLQKRRTERERRTVATMIRLFCRLKHDSGKEVCESCAQLLEYVYKRLDHCQFGTEKPVCNRCPVHCYKLEMREKIREIMRFSGPRMVVFHPLLTLLHSIDKI